MSEKRPVVLLGVSGGVAAYKAVEVARGFQRAGCDVHACLTRNAARFVGPLTFEAVTGHPVPVGGLGGDRDAAMDHVEITRDLALFAIAPATANVIGKLAHGIADDWLTTHHLASEAPLLIAPAMNQRMWRHPAVRDNLRLLETRGARVLAPEEGELACGEEGPGRLPDPQAIVSAGLSCMASRGAGPWSGRRVLITAGPTLEDLDPVRFLGNRSSGRMGYALAAEAAARGAHVVLVTGPVALPPPAGVTVHSVRSADDMASVVARELPGSDAAFFAAAVADFRPVREHDRKLRREGRGEWSLELAPTRDVLAESVAASTGALLVGFAAETAEDAEALLAAAQVKLAAKGCDLVVANVVGGPASAFDAEHNEVVLVGPEGLEIRVERAPKRAVAGRLLDEIAARLPAAGRGRGGER